MQDEFPQPQAASADELARHEAGLRVLERLRGELDDDVLDLATDAVRARIRALRAGTPHGDKRVGQCTVLFVDVVGSTPLGGKLDPEAVHLVMDAALERFTLVIQRFGGRVMQYAGDSVMGAFGVEGAREDDATRAVACGLALVADAQLLADRVRRQHRHAGFGVRVGVHTGPVLLGGGVEGDNTIRGGTVNLAARMEQTAPTFGVRITAATHRLVSGHFELEAQPPLAVKGYAEPQATWLVHRRLPARAAVSQRGVHGVQTALVGRSAELARLQQAWHDWRALGGLSSVRVQGEAGLGKTRLLAEWQTWALSQPLPQRWIGLRAWPACAELPHALLHALLAELLGLPEAEPPDLSRERFLAQAVPLLDALGPHAEAEAAVLGHLLGLNFIDHPALQGIGQQGGQIRQRGWHAAQVLLRRWACTQPGPVVLVLDDLHWADPESLRFLADWQAQPDPPTVLLAQARRDRATEPVPVAVHLQPLPEAETCQLAQALLAPLPDAPPSWIAALVARAGGNPFALEELVQMLLDRGTVVAEPGASSPPRWRLGPQAFDAAALPTTLVGVMQARLAGLPAGAARALQQAAVLGETFDLATLRALDADAGTAVAALEARGLLQPRGAADAGGYGFASPLMQQLAYEQLLREHRTALHRRAGHWLLGLGQPDRLPEAAEHLERGEDAAAAETAQQAAEHLAGRFAHAAVARQASRALRLLPAHAHGQRWPALVLRQRALRLSGLPEHADDLEAMAAIAQRTGSAQHGALVAVRRMIAAGETGHAREAAAAYPAARAAAQAADDGLLQAQAHAAGAAALRALGRHDEAQAAAAEGLALVRSRGLLALEAEMLLALAAVATERGDPAASRPLLQQALLAQRERGDLFGECVSRINLGVTDLQLGDQPAAEALFTEALALAARAGHRLHAVSAHLNRSTTRQEAGNAEGARADAESALALARELGNPEYEAFSLLALAGAHDLQGEVESALRTCEASTALLRQLGQPHLALEPLAHQAVLLLRLGRQDAARQAVEPVLQALAERGHLDGCERPLRMRLQCIEVLQALDDPRAGPALSDAITALAEQQARLPEALRSTFVQGHPQHRRLQALAGS